MQTVEMTRPAADRYGRKWEKGRRFEVSDKTADAFLRRGIAVVVPSDAERAVKLLAELGGGLFVTGKTDPSLVKAAKAAKLPVKHSRPGRPKKAVANGKQRD